MVSSPPARCRARVRRLGALAVVGTLVLGGCSDSDSRAPAVWTVRSGHRVGPNTTTFTAAVQRLGCNNGVTGDVDPPDVEVEDETVTITFTVEPIRGDATCPDNKDTYYEVVLPEPLGDRSLVDGQCESDATAGRTPFCRPDGVRHSPE